MFIFDVIYVCIKANYKFEDIVRQFESEVLDNLPNLDDVCCGIESFIVSGINKNLLHHLILHQKTKIINLKI